MIPLLSRAQVRALDEHASGVCHVPSLVLMENAGRGAADVIERDVLGGRAEGRRVVVVCGTGNNGGDGFVVARQLVARGARCEAWLVGDVSKLTVDCRLNYDAFTGVGGRIERVPSDAVGRLPDALAEADVIVDALFGTGLARPIAGLFAAVVDVVNEATAPKVALDVPSGMNADTGAAMGKAVRAAITVTFARRKLGLVTGEGARLSGVVRVVDIGIPPSLCVDKAADLAEARDVRAHVRPRPIDSHKYRAGHVAVLGGSPGKVGAALLAAHGALRGGAGAATIVTWPRAAAAIESRVVEVMTTRLDGRAALGTQLDAAMAHKRAVIMGPGFGLDEDAKAAVRHVLANYMGNVVIDADALTMHAGAIETFATIKGHAVLTPHAGELARLLGTTSEEIERDRFAAVRSAAHRARAVVLLKGPFTLVASPDGRLVVNPTGNPVLATAGSGDVLSGLLGALACTLPVFEAAWCAAYLHGAAGDAWKAKNGDRGLLASGIADEVPGVLCELLA